MPKHIAGNPNMIVQNMPGAGGLAATNYLYGMAKADGLTLGMFQAHRYMQQLTGVEEVKFDLRKFNWIGTMEKTEVMFFVRADTPYKSFDDAVKSSEPLRCVATGSTDGTYLLANGCCNHTFVEENSCMGRRRVNARKKFERLKRRQRSAQVLSERQ